MSKSKVAWVSKESPKGWRLAVNVGGKQYNLKGLIMKSPADVDELRINAGCVFVHLANSKWGADGKRIKKSR